jgi:recombination protein RecA
VVSKTNTCVLFINQIRQKIGVMFGNPETTTGGLALKFYSSVRLEIRRAAQIQSGEKIVGNRVKCKVVKNKVAAPFRTCEFDILYNEGISAQADLINAGIQYGLVEKQGSWYSYNGEKIGQGMEGTRKAVKENPKLELELRHKVTLAAAVVDAEPLKGEMGPKVFKR